MFVQSPLSGGQNNRQQTQYEDEAVDRPKPARPTQHPPRANAGHVALAEILEENPNIRMITQNVDGLHPPSNRLIEAHGRLGLYKCLPAEDSDTDSDSDDDDEREVHLGHRRKRRTTRSGCPYQRAKSLTVSQLVPTRTRDALLKVSDPSLASSSSSGTASSAAPPSVQTNDPSQQPAGGIQLQYTPKCPYCGNPVAPQALLFDEGYHAHDFYQFRRMEEWIAKAEVIVFCGTSFSGVTLTEVALEHAREQQLPVYNFNTQDFLESTIRLNAENISGPSEETLPMLREACREASEGLSCRGSSSATASSGVRRSARDRGHIWTAKVTMPSSSPATSPIRVKC
jgi:NAD-dependent SIR2 family protein deacetylase